MRWLLESGADKASKIFGFSVAPALKYSTNSPIASSSSVFRPARRKASLTSVLNLLGVPAVRPDPGRHPLDSSGDLVARQFFTEPGSKTQVFGERRQDRSKSVGNKPLLAARQQRTLEPHRGSD